MKFQKEAEKFVEVATRFCVWAESRPKKPIVEARTAQRFLCELHLAVLDLPKIDKISEFLAEIEEDKKETNRLERYKKFVKRFALLPFDKYAEIFNPLNLEETSVIATVSDDLADIYLELKKGLSYWERDFCYNAIWEWKFSFEIHWGEHLTGAQRAIHAYLSENDAGI